jgi:hypothetical protein
VEKSVPSETKEEATASSLKDRIVGSFTNIGTFKRTNRRRMVMHLDRLVPYEGTTLRREQRERLERKHRGKAEPREGR